MGFVDWVVPTVLPGRALAWLELVVTLACMLGMVVMGQCELVTILNYSNSNSGHVMRMVVH